MSEQIHAAIDIGTSSIQLFVGRETEQEELEIIAHVEQPARGIKRGIVVDIESATNSIGRALQQAAVKADVEIAAAYISISGNHLRGFNGRGSVVAEQGEITPQQITRLMDTVRASSKEHLAPDYVFTHILPQEYALDKQEGIRHPLGMTGNILEMRAHIISFPRGAVENLRRCVEKNNLHVQGLVATPLADGYAVLTDDEKELGVCLVNMGAGTTEVAVYFRGNLAFSLCLPIAGDQVTSDIAYMFTAPTSEAEKLKLSSGHLGSLEGIADTPLTIMATGNRERGLSVGMLTDVLRQRYRELFSMVVSCVEESSYSQRLGAGVVITGGGANIPGLVEFAEECMGVQVRVGLPFKVSSLVGDLAKPEYATGIGLLHHAVHESARNLYHQEPPSGLLGRLIHWIKRSF